MANSVDPDQTAPKSSPLWVQAVFFDNLLVNNVRQLFAADDFSRRHFQMHFFLGAVRVKQAKTCRLTKGSVVFSKCTILMLSPAGRDGM